MPLRPCSAPGAWGVETPDDPANPAWTRVLDELAAAGFPGTELGPLGFLPSRADDLGGALRERGLGLVGGFVMQPFHDPAERERIEQLAVTTCDLLSALGASQLLLMEALVPVRSRTAGRAEAAPALDDAGWERLVDCVEAVARIAAQRELVAAFHPHAGTYVEFAPEIERLLAATDPALVHLCIDTAHSLYAGVDPVDLYRRHAERTTHLHLKDLRLDLLAQCLERELSFEAAVAARVFCPLGEGAVDFAALRDALEQGGYDGWGTLEQDRLPTDASDPCDDARASLAHLRRVGLVAQDLLAAKEVAR